MFDTTLELQDVVREACGTELRHEKLGRDWPEPACLVSHDLGQKGGHHETTALGWDFLSFLI